MLFGIAVALFLWYLIEAKNLAGTGWEVRLSLALKILLLASILFLLKSPVLNTSVRSFSRPDFLLVVDDTASMTWQDTSGTAAWIQKLDDALSRYGEVRRQSLLEMGGWGQLASEAEGSRAVFLATDADGFHPGISRPGIPVYALHFAREVGETPGIRVLAYPDEAYQDQNLSLILEALHWPKEQDALDLHWGFSDQEQFQDKRLLSQGQGQFEISLKAAKSGLQTIQVQAGEVGINVSTLIHSEPARVSLVAQAPGADTGFWLRQLSEEPSLRVSAIYLGLNQLPEPSDLLIFWDLPVERMKKLLEEHEGPVIFCVEKPGGLDFADAPKAVGISDTGGDWRWVHSHIPAFEDLLFGGYGQPKELLAALPGLDLPFGMKATESLAPLLAQKISEEEYPLALAGRWQNRSAAFFIGSAVRRLQWQRGMQEEIRALARRLIPSVAVWLIQGGQVGAASLEGPHLVQEGDLAEWVLHAPEGTRITLRRSGEDPPEEIEVLSGRWRRSLPAGSYLIEAQKQGKTLMQEPLLVQPSRGELTLTQEEKDSFQDFIADTGGGILEMKDGKEPLGLVPGRILAEEFRVVESQWSLQASTWLLLILSLLMSVEWIFRYVRRMV